MNSSYTNKAVILRLIWLSVFVAGGCFSFVYSIWELVVVAIIGVIATAWSLLYFIQNMHRKVHLFFEAIKNEDGSLHFSENQQDKHLKGLYQSLNRINQFITEIRIREVHSERFFKEFMKRSASGLMAVDQDNFVEIINDAALKIIGLANLTHLDRLQDLYPSLHELLLQLKSGQSQSIKLLEGNELRQITVKVVDIRFSEKEYRIFSLYDIKNEIEENELETWQKLMRIMTHEIMNSIAPISSLSQTLNRYFIKEGAPVQLQDLNQDEIDNTVKGLTVIEERATGLRAFVDNYRKLSKLPQAEFSSIELNHWLDSIKLLFKAQTEEHKIDFKITHTYPKPSFPGDEKLLTHVVLNLLNNATQALEKQENKSIEIVTEANELGSLRLKVIDNGEGFKAEERDKIFLPFYTSRENGSGIGLSLSRQIMRMHKGSISASSEPGVRTEFVLEI